MRFVVLDIDNTLTGHNSWAELTRALGAALDDHLAIYRRLGAGELTTAEAARRIVDLWRSTGNGTRAAITAAFDRMPLRTGAVELVNWLYGNGFRPVLISGSMDLFVAAVARRLGVDTWYAGSRLEFDADGNLAALTYRLEQGRAKLEQLRQLCAESGVDIRTVIAVGDGENDQEIFAATGRGILLGPRPDVPWPDVPRPDVPRPGVWRAAAELSEIPALLGDLVES